MIRIIKPWQRRALALLFLGGIFAILWRIELVLFHTPGRATDSILYLLLGNRNTIQQELLHYVREGHFFAFYLSATLLIAWAYQQIRHLLTNRQKVFWAIEHTTLALVGIVVFTQIFLPDAMRGWFKIINLLGGLLLMTLLPPLLAWRSRWYIRNQKWRLLPLSALVWFSSAFVAGFICFVVNEIQPRYAGDYMLINFMLPMLCLALGLSYVSPPSQAKPQPSVDDVFG